LPSFTAMAADTTPTARKKYFASMFILCDFAKESSLRTVSYRNSNIISFL
jgi:hypothetical protein